MKKDKRHLEEVRDDIEKMICNPFYVIEIDPGLTVPHETIVPKDQWIKTNVEMIKEIGPEKWLRTLLDVLNGNYYKGE